MSAGPEELVFQSSKRLQSDHWQQQDWRMPLEPHLYVQRASVAAYVIIGLQMCRTFAGSSWARGTNVEIL